MLPAYRRQGCAQALLRALAGIARERGCGRFEWAVLDWNASAIAFYQSLGATVLPDWRIVRVVGPALDSWPTGRADPVAAVTVIPSAAARARDGAARLPRASTMRIATNAGNPRLCAAPRRARLPTRTPMPDADRFTLPDLPPLRLDADFWSLRWVDETCESYAVRKNVALPLRRRTDRGAMATVYAGGGYGYAATGDTSPAGLRGGARARGGAGARHREVRAGRLAHAAPPGGRAANTRRRHSRPRRARAASGTNC